MSSHRIYEIDACRRDGAEYVSLAERGVSSTGGPFRESQNRPSKTNLVGLQRERPIGCCRREAHSADRPRGDDAVCRAPQRPDQCPDAVDHDPLQGTRSGSIGKRSGRLKSGNRRVRGASTFKTPNSDGADQSTRPPAEIPRAALFLGRPLRTGARAGGTGTECSRLWA